MKALFIFFILHCSVVAIHEEKEKSESLSQKVININKQRRQYLEKYLLITSLVKLIEEYDPIENWWKWEKIINDRIFFRIHYPSTLDRVHLTSFCMLPGNKLISGYLNGKIEIHDINSGKLFKSKLRIDENIQSLCVLPDNKFASIDLRTPISIWDIDSCVCNKTILNNVIALCLVSENRLAASVIDDPENCHGEIRIIDLESDKCYKILKIKNYKAYSLCLLPNCKLAMGCLDGTIIIWSFNSLLSSTTKLKGHEGTVKTLCLLPDNKLASGSNDKTIRIWDIKSGKCQKVLKMKEEDGPTEFHVLCALPGNQLASGSYYPAVIIWDLNSEDYHIAHEMHHYNTILGLCLYQENKLISADSKGEIIVSSNPVISLLSHSDQEFKKFVQERDSLYLKNNKN